MVMDNLSTNEIPSITIGPLKTKDRVIINVGGTKHECYISTIQNFPDTRLYWIAETALKMADFDPDNNEFFFDRHPGCFQNIMNYCRTGKLHCPNDVCGPLFEQELAFWGVDELMMEPCCWGMYTQHRDAHQNLKMFDLMFEEETEGEQDDEDGTKKRLLSKHMSPWQRFVFKGRPFVWNMLEKPFSSRFAQIAAVLSMLVIIVSITTFCLQTMDNFKGHDRVFLILEYIYCAFFTLEFLIRLVCCPSFKEFFTSFLNYIDLISTLQFYIAFFVMRQGELDFLFVSRLIRIFRLFRFFKKLSGMQVIAQTLKASLNELMLLLLIVMIPMVIFSTLIYYAEKNHELGSKDFNSIPEAFWWAIVTMTTVGYGDVYPRSGPAKIIGVMCACSGVLIVALPVSVIGSNFTLYYSYAQARMKLPQRRSPALVSADKALISNNNSQNKDPDEPTPPAQPGKKRKNGGAMLAGLAETANVALDLAVPSVGGRERRQALQPTINPIRSSKKEKSVMAGLGQTLFSTTLQTIESKQNSDREDNDEDNENNNNNDVEETCVDDNHEENIPPGGLQSKDLLRVGRYLNRSDSIGSVTSLTSDCSSVTSHKVIQRPRAFTNDSAAKRKIHIDLSQYTPVRMSPLVIRQRRKRSEIKQVHNRPPDTSTEHSCRSNSVNSFDMSGKSETVKILTDDNKRNCSITIEDDKLAPPHHHNGVRRMFMRRSRYSEPNMGKAEDNSTQRSASSASHKFMPSPRKQTGKVTLLQKRKLSSDSTIKT